MEEEEERIKELQQEYRDKIDYYQESKSKISKELEGKEGRDKEYVEVRMESCQRLIDDYTMKLNPTKKKEMYK